MPTYDYECGACEHTLEIFQSINDSPKRKCPKCGRMKLRRLIGSGAAVVFKGSGFYQTDYRSDSYKKRAEADRKAASEASSGDKSSSSSSDKSKSSAKSSTAASSGSGDSKKKAK
jgi:putative FmdB family regulatory protein